MKILKLLLKVGATLFALAIISLVAMLSGSFHTPMSFHVFGPIRAAGLPVLVVGATQNTGLEVVRELLARGQPVVATVRSSSNTAALDALGVKKVVMDAMDAQQVRDTIVAERYSAVISTVGTAARDLPERRNLMTALFEGPAKMDPAKRPDYVGNRNLIDATKAAGIRRFVFVTVIGTGNSFDAAPVPARRGLMDIIPLKNKAEDHLRSSGLDYTIIRPGGLGPRALAATHTARLTEDPASFSYIARKDLARLVVDALGDATTVGHTYTAWDPSRRNVWNLFID
jgi:uncharacterized protein YbjT (DUF2867 family)